MMNDIYLTSHLFLYSAVLMSVSAILISVCASILYGILLFASAACMFFAARYFRIAEEQKENERRGAEQAHEKENIS